MLRTGIHRLLIVRIGQTIPLLVLLRRRKVQHAKILERDVDFLPRQDVHRPERSCVRRGRTVVIIIRIRIRICTCTTMRRLGLELFSISFFVRHCLCLLDHS
jgi:hypothetical protein